MGPKGIGISLFESEQTTLEKLFIELNEKHSLENCKRLFAKYDNDEDGYL